MQRAELPLEGKGIVITGAGRGLGRAYALDAAHNGAFVLVNDVDGAAAGAVANEIETTGGYAVADDHSVADWDQARDIINHCITAFGRLDGLVNNAGVVHYAYPWQEELMRLSRWSP